MNITHSSIHSTTHLTTYNKRRIPSSQKSTQEIERHEKVFSITLNGRAVQVRPGQTILEITKQHGIALPHLCHEDTLRPVGQCRACVVEIKGERTLAPSCCREPQPDSVIDTNSARVKSAQKMILQLLHSESQ